MSTLRSGRTLPTPGQENQPSSSRTDGGGTGAVPTRTEPTPNPNSNPFLSSWPVTSTVARHSLVVYDDNKVTL